MYLRSASRQRNSHATACGRRRTSTDSPLATRRSKARSAFTAGLVESSGLMVGVRFPRQKPARSVGALERCGGSPRWLAAMSRYVATTKGARTSSYWFLRVFRAGCTVVSTVEAAVLVGGRLGAVDVRQAALRATQVVDFHGWSSGCSETEEAALNSSTSTSDHRPIGQVRRLGYSVSISARPLSVTNRTRPRLT
jgi:hypothetical protein